MAFIINPRNLADSVSRPVRFVYCASVSLVYRGHETGGRVQSCLIRELLAWGLLKEPRPAWCDMAGETKEGHAWSNGFVLDLGCVFTVVGLPALV